MGELNREKIMQNYERCSLYELMDRQVLFRNLSQSLDVYVSHRQPHGRRAWKGGRKRGSKGNISLDKILIQNNHAISGNFG